MDVNQHYAALLGLGDEWTVTDVALDVPGKRVDVYVEYAKKSATCPECGELAGIHDRLEERSWRHLDTMQFVTEIHARTPRVSCPKHGVKVIELPWASKSSRFTLLFEAFAIDVLKAAKSIKDAQGILRLSWCQTRQIMAAAVKRGMARRDADEIPFVGMDEKSFRRGKKADAVAGAVIGLLASLPKGFLKSLTFDNGKEFAKFEQIKQALGIEVYFAKPYHSWERGTNENCNGVVRKVLPKGRSFDDIAEGGVRGTPPPAHAHRRIAADRSLKLSALGGGQRHRKAEFPAEARFTSQTKTATIPTTSKKASSEQGYATGIALATGWRGFDNLSIRNQNVAYVLAAKKEVTGSLGVTFEAFRTCTVYVESNQTGDNGECREETVAHEIGHRFGLIGLVGGWFGYIDKSNINTHSHDALDMCLMSYDNQDNGVTEFSKACILDGSSINGNDSLRKRVDD